MNSSQPNSKQSAPGKWREVFALDYRSMALFRILLGGMLLADLAFRLPTLVAMYTDWGVLPRSVIGEYYDKWVGVNWQYGIWSFHWLSGDAWLQYLLFSVAAVAATALMLGWKTRIATLISWLLLASLHARNPLILTSGDTILKLVLFWSTFLPLGRIWSMDSCRNSEANAPVGKRFYSLATFALIMQIVLMYFFTGVAKCNEDWFSGEAMQYVLRLDIYALPVSAWLLQYPLIMTIVTYATLFIELILIWFLLSPKRNDFWRVVVMFSYWGFHLGIGVSMAIGLFPLICLVIWIPLIPTSCWHWLGRRKGEPKGQVDVLAFAPVQLIYQSVIVVAMAFVVLINVSNIDHPVCKKLMFKVIEPVGCWLNLDQRFQMFGHPPKSNPWFVYEATLRDKSQVDLLRDSTVDHKRPSSVRLSLPTHHWRKLHRNLVHPLRAEVRQSLADYAVREWNATHEEGQQVVRMRLLCYSEAIGPEYDGTSVQQTVWGSYEDPERGAGSSFDSAIEGMLDGLPF